MKIINKTDEPLKYTSCLGFISKTFKASKKDNIIIVNIGTDRYSGDCFAPLLGTILTKHTKLTNIKVYGTLEEPIHANNVEDKIAEILKAHPNDFILAVGGTFGTGDKFDLVLRDTPFCPGKALDRVLPPVGDMSLLFSIETQKFLEESEESKFETISHLTKEFRMGIHYSHVAKILPFIEDLDKLLYIWRE